MVGVIVWVVIGMHFLGDELPFVAKVFTAEAVAEEWANNQNASQADMVFSVHGRYLE